MSISMNPKKDGFRKWAEIHEPRKAEKAPPGADQRAVAPADGDQGAKTPEEQPHRPWLVPGVGKL